MGQWSEVQFEYGQAPYALSLMRWRMQKHG
jgi:hypothetical protein